MNFDGATDADTHSMPFVAKIHIWKRTLKRFEMNSADDHVDLVYA